MNNDNENLNIEPTTEILIIEPPKRSWWKYSLGAIGLIILFVGGYVGWKVYDFESGVRKVQQTAELLKKLEAEDYKAAMADTYGGKTPQETLQMYIDAVEKGDYKLASKYFIGDKQEKELKSFNGTPKEDIEKYIKLLRQGIKGINNDNYDSERKYLSFYEPILLRMKIYPNGIWKIIEI